MGPPDKLVNPSFASLPKCIHTGYNTVVNASHHLIMVLVVAFGIPSVAIISDARSAKKPREITPSPKSATKFASFVQKLAVEGTDDIVQSYVAPFLALAPNTPSKAYILDELPREADNRPEKICKLIFEPDEAEQKHPPKCIVLIAGYVNDETNTSNYYKISLDEKLLTAFQLTGRRSGGKPIRGSGVKHDLDVNSPEVQADFKKELDFWLSGRYKKYLKPKKEAKAASSP